jgi:PAS domain S-box-containing protein
METLQDVMTALVITIAPDRPVSHALAIMEQRRISALVVAEEKKPLGIITERALIQIRAGGEIDYSQPIHLVMSSPPFTASVDMDYREAYQLLLDHRIRHLVVTDHDGHLVGIVTVTDFLSHLGLEYFMEFKNVDQVMIRDVITLKSSSSAFAAMKLMNDRRISSLVIEEDGSPQGIVTERDLLRLIRSKIKLEDIRLHEVMSQPVQTVFADVSSHTAAKILLGKSMRRLVVTNSSGRCVGIITETDLIKGLRTSYTDHLKDVIQQQARQLNEARQQVEYEVSLQAERDFSKKIIDKTPSIICAITPDGTIQFVNPAGEQLTGYSATELLGKNWQDYFYAGKTGRPTEEMLKKFQEDDVREYEVRLKTKDGALRDISWSSVKRFCAKGAFFETLILGNDVTERKKAVQELEKKKKEAEEANIALKVMLDQHTRARESIEEQIAVKLKELVIPYLDLLRQSTITEKQDETINIIAAHIDSITQSFSPKVREIALGLSPRETMIADLVWQGKTSKDISEILNLSLRTVETYRNNLRKKLGINKRKISLRTYLMTHFTQ